MLLSPRAAVAGLVLPRLRLLGSCTCLVAHALGLPQEAFLSRGQTRRCRCGSSLSILPLYVPRLGVGVGAALETPRVAAKGRACHFATIGPADSS